MRVGEMVRAGPKGPPLQVGSTEIVDGVVEVEAVDEGCNSAGHSSSAQRLLNGAPPLLVAREKKACAVAQAPTGRIPPGGFNLIIVHRSDPGNGS